MFFRDVMDRLNNCMSFAEKNVVCKALRKIFYQTLETINQKPSLAKKKSNLLCSIHVLLFPIPAFFKITSFPKKLRRETGMVGLVLLCGWR